MMAAPYFATFHVTRAFLPAMLRRNSGHAYLAARWAVRGLAEALRSDLTGSGIGVTLYGSGVVRSPYREHNPGSLGRVPWVGSLVPALTPEAAARAIVRGIRREKRLVVVPFMMRLTYWMHALFPGVVQWLMTRTGYPRPPV